MLFWDYICLLYSNIVLSSYVLTNFFIEVAFQFFTSIDRYILLILDFLEITTYFNLSHSSVSLINIAIKFLLCISLLIFARGGIPRFRFDYLTKLG